MICPGMINTASPGLKIRRVGFLAPPTLVLDLFLPYPRSTGKLLHRSSDAPPGPPVKGWPFPQIRKTASPFLSSTHHRTSRMPFAVSNCVGTLGLIWQFTVTRRHVEA